MRHSPSAAFGAGNVLLDSDSIALPFFGSAGSAGPLSVAAAGITKFTVTTDQSQGSIDFAIDTVRFETGSAVPFPATIVLLATGLVGAAAVTRARRPASRHGA